MTVTDFHVLTATEIAGLVGRGELSPVDLVDALLERVEALEQRLQVWAALDADGARRQAKARCRLGFLRRRCARYRITVSPVRRPWVGTVGTNSLAELMMQLYAA